MSDSDLQTLTDFRSEVLEPDGKPPGASTRFRQLR